jgi:hypothetical protein
MSKNSKYGYLLRADRAQRAAGGGRAVADGYTEWTYERRRKGGVAAK